jgi:hypothetical protein
MMAGYIAVVLLVITLMPRESAAQTLAPTSGQSSFQAAIAAIADAQSPLLSMARQSDRPARPPLSRGGWIALGTGIGFGGGLVFGEYYFGRRLDLPHGPDMLIGGAIGAGAGALIAWLATRGSNRSPSKLPTAIDWSRTESQLAPAPANAAGGGSLAITITKPDVQTCDPL